MLDQKRRKSLAGQAHQLKPCIAITGGVVRDSHLDAIRSQFQTRELIKVRVLADSKASVETVAAAICAATGCELIARTGYIAVFYLPGASIK